MIRPIMMNTALLVAPKEKICSLIQLKGENKYKNSENNIIVNGNPSQMMVIKEYIYIIKRVISIIQLKYKQILKAIE
ncbi:hypothetical protein [Clostridium sp. YIM B02555]|uniref:hypothetical protein n=1 Tax=Clostridium sp. YIM B02555 TaxID=2911968 RepID=UPI001EED703C|nr:hypothetical protein [Clostridium sp. YIM B02555]